MLLELNGVVLQKDIIWDVETEILFPDRVQCFGTDSSLFLEVPELDLCTCWQTNIVRLAAISSLEEQHKPYKQQ